MSVLSPVLALAAFAVSLLAPPALPPEPDPSTQPAPAADPPLAPAPEPAPAPPRTSGGERSTLPPGLEPVPFPLEQRRPEAAPIPNPNETPDELAPAPAPPQPQRRSIVDLRDPFDRPPPRPRPGAHRQAAVGRLLIPDLKDPFAPGVRRVRSKRLDVVVPNDIRDPFRDRPRLDSPRSPCVKTTADGTVVQAPGKDNNEACPVPITDLRDPFRH